MAADNSVKFKVYAPGYQALSTTSSSGISWTLGFCVPIYDPAFDPRTVDMVDVSNVDFLKENGITHSEWWAQYETMEAGAVHRFDGEKIWLRGSFDSTGRYVRNTGYVLTGNILNDPIGLFSQDRLVSQIIPAHCWQVKPYTPLKATAASGAVTAGSYEAVIPSDAGDFVFNKMAVFIKKLDSNGQDTGEIMFFGMVYSNVNLMKKFYGYGSVVNMTLKLNVVVRANVTSYDDYVFLNEGFWKYVTDRTIGVEFNTAHGSIDHALGPIIDRGRVNAIFGDAALDSSNNWLSDSSSMWNAQLITRMIWQPFSFAVLGQLITNHPDVVGYHHRLGDGGQTGANWGDMPTRYSAFLTPFMLDANGAQNSGMAGNGPGNFVFGHAHPFGQPGSFFREVGGMGNFIFDLYAGAFGSTSQAEVAPTVMVSAPVGGIPIMNTAFGSGHTVGGMGNFVAGYGGVGGDLNMWGSITHGSFLQNFGQNNRVGQFGAPHPSGTGTRDLITRYTAVFGLTNDVVNTDCSMVVGQCNKTISSFAYIFGSDNDSFGGAWLVYGPDAQTHMSGTDIPGNTASRWAPSREGLLMVGHRNMMYSERLHNSGANFVGTDHWYDVFIFGHRNRVGINGNPIQASFVGGEEMTVRYSKHSLVFGNRSYMSYNIGFTGQLYYSTVMAGQYGQTLAKDSYQESNWISRSLLQGAIISDSYSSSVVYYNYQAPKTSNYATSPIGWFGTGIMRNHPKFGTDHKYETTINGYNSWKSMLGDQGSPYGVFYRSYRGYETGGITGTAVYECWSRIVHDAIRNPGVRTITNAFGSQAVIHYMYDKLSQPEPLYSRPNTSSPLPEGVANTNKLYVRQTALPALRDGSFSNSSSLTGAGRHLYMYFAFTTGFSREIRGQLARVISFGSLVTINGAGYIPVTIADPRELSGIAINYAGTPLRFHQIPTALIEIEPMAVELLLMDYMKRCAVYWETDPTTNTSENVEPSAVFFDTPSMTTSQMVCMKSNFRQIGGSNGYISSCGFDEIANCDVNMSEVYFDRAARCRLFGAAIEFRNTHPDVWTPKAYLADPMANPELGERWHFQTEWDHIIYNQFGTYDTVFTEAFGTEIRVNYSNAGGAGASNGGGHGAYNRFFGHKLYVGHDFYDGSVGSTGIMFADIFGLDISVMTRDSGSGATTPSTYFANFNMFARGIHMLLTRSDQFVMGKLNKGSRYNMFEFGVGEYAYNDPSWWHRANAFSVGYLTKGGYTPGDYDTGDDYNYRGYNLAFKVDCGMLMIGNDDTPHQKGVIVRKFSTYTGRLSPNGTGGGTYGLWCRRIHAGDFVRLICPGDPSVNDLTKYDVQLHDFDPASTVDYRYEASLAVSLPAINNTSAVGYVPPTSTVMLDSWSLSQVIGVALTDPDADGLIIVAIAGGPVQARHQLAGNYADIGWYANILGSGKIKSLGINTSTATSVTGTPPNQVSSAYISWREFSCWIG